MNNSEYAKGEDELADVKNRYPSKLFKRHQLEI